MQPRSEFLTVQETAGLLRLAENTVYELLSRGDLPGRKIGGSWRIPRKELFRDADTDRKVEVAE